MAEEYTQVLFEEETTMEVEKEILYFETIEAPLKTGDKVGEIKYYVNKVETGCVSIVAAEDIERAGFGDYFKKALDYFFLEWS
jgi:D-alanyl-D-alanine carboxypeptidase (penicillin-binding protein 5/6)